MDDGVLSGPLAVVIVDPTTSARNCFASSTTECKGGLKAGVATDANVAADRMKAD